MQADSPKIRAQACQFRRYASDKKVKVRDSEPGIAFLEIFNHYDVTFIVDSNGEKLSREEVHSYDLLQLRVDGYINITPYDYLGKAPAHTLEDDLTQRAIAASIG